MLEGLMIGAVTALTSFNLLLIAVGCLSGMLIGMLPGLGPISAIALLIPVSYALSPESGIIMLAGVYYGAIFGGSTSSILLNAPGVAGTVATAFDGYPMTQKGMAGKAVGAAVLCSAIGGVASAIVMMSATEPLAQWAIMNIGPPEIFALVFFGLAVASSVGGRTIWKGWLSVLLGLLIATIGQDPVGGINRFNFGYSDLAAGIAFVPAILGFFAVSEIFIQAEKNVSGKYSAPKFNVDFPSFFELWAHKIAVVRSILVGFFCGILPGIGATLAAFMGYGEAVRWSKNKSEFGTGKLEGVISSETANNAATGAAMIPLLALGLPGGALTAMMVAVFQMHDLEPGPLVFYNSPELIWIVFAAMFYANLSILFVGLIETKTILYLLKIPFQFLAPMILMLASIGAYISRGLVLDVIVMFIAGIIGFLLRRSGYSIPGIVLGLILGKIGEQNFAQGMQMVHYDLGTYFSRPICTILIVAGVLTLLKSLHSAFFQKPKVT